MIYRRQGIKEENQPPINIETDVKFANASLSDEIPEIIMRDGKGREVVRVPDTKYHYIYCVKGTEPGNENNAPVEIVPEAEIKHYQVVKGKEVEVGKFERTKNIVVDRFMPKIEMDLWQVDSTYEVWADHTHGLYEIAKDLEARDEVGISKLSFGGFKESYALISSVREGDKFVITMSLSQKRKKLLSLDAILECGRQRLQARRQQSTGIARRDLTRSYVTILASVCYTDRPTCRGRLPLK